MNPLPNFISSTKIDEKFISLCYTQSFHALLFFRPGRVFFRPMISIQLTPTLFVETELQQLWVEFFHIPDWPTSSHCPKIVIITNSPPPQFLPSINIFSLKWLKLPKSKCKLFRSLLKHLATLFLSIRDCRSIVIWGHLFEGNVKPFNRIGGMTCLVSKLHHNGIPKRGRPPVSAKKNPTLAAQLASRAKELMFNEKKLTTFSTSNIHHHHTQQHIPVHPSWCGSKNYTDERT